MKKVLLFISIAFMSLPMTSCFENARNSFSEKSIVYVADYNGVKYGKTLSGRIVVSEKIKEFPLKSLKMFAYNWDEGYGYTQIGNTSAFNIAITGDVVDVTQTVLNPIPIASEEEPPVFFKNLLAPFYPNSVYYPFNDLWLFEYSLMIKQGQTPNVRFYLREPKSETPDLAEIDIRIEKTGNPEASATDKEMRTIVAVDMAGLEQRFPMSPGVSQKTIGVKFYYYLEGKTTLSETQTFYFTKTAKSS